MSIVINGTTINYITDKSFFKKVGEGKWEQQTFKIIDQYFDKDKLFLDIGSWNGITSLYASSKYKKVISIEADPKAIQKFNMNLSVNNIDNITLIPKALSDSVGKTIFGGNGYLGNSESTLLVGDNYFIDKGGDVTRGTSINTKQYRTGKLVEVETIDINSLVDYLDIPIGLVKIDIEGGEKIVIPNMISFLENWKCAVLLSLHWVFLTLDDIKQILDNLFNIYPNCYHKGKRVDKQQIIDRKITSILLTYS